MALGRGVTLRKAGSHAGGGEDEGVALGRKSSVGRCWERASSKVAKTKRLLRALRACRACISPTHGGGVCFFLPGLVEDMRLRVDEAEEGDGRTVAGW